MPNMDVLQQLRDKVGNAVGPDRVLDGEIMKALDPEKWAFAYRKAQEPSGCPPDLADKDARRWAPGYTGSIDTAFALVKIALPGWRPGVWETPVGWDAEVAYPEPRYEDGPTGRRRFFSVMSGDSSRATAPLAVLVAMLDAIILEEQKSNG